MVKSHPWSLALVAIFALSWAVSACVGFAPGQAIGHHFWSFFLQMLAVLPCVFLLIGLFEVWVRTQTVEKYLGKGSGALSYLWAVLLGGTIVGGLHIALPIAHALHVKRARLGVVVTYLSAAGICRVPMTLFEASFLGWRFSCVRLAVSLPLVVLSSAALGAWFERRRYALPQREA